MKTRSLIAGLAIAFLGAAQLGAQPPIPAPGPEHKHLESMAGTWDCTIKSPDGSGDSKAVAVSKMECGGLWLISTFEGDFGGMKFQGRGMDGYDPKKKKYVNVWVDSMSTTPMVSEGDYDEKTKTTTMVGEGFMGDQPTKFKGKTIHKDKDHYTYKMYIIGEDGSEAEMMTIEYARKK